jgi:methylase of polypeptide subunit release factors
VLIMDSKEFVENHIPNMDNPEKVYQLFKGLGYEILDPSFRGKEAWGLRETDKEFVKEIYTIANYKKRFQIFLVELKSYSPTTIRNLPIYFERETQYPFFVITSDYRNYTFILVEKIREDVGVWKRKLVKLNLDRESAFYTDKWVLSEITIRDGIKDPLRIYAILKEAFGIQKVTKKFFTEYKIHFDLLVESLKRNNKGVKQFYDQDKLYAFAQRFLGRLMFLYFLQKKGWLAGDQKFILHWFEKSKSNGKNFYQSVLEPLFFATLNRKRPGDHSAFGRIPFLNGGLFEKDYEEFIYIPDDTIEKILNFLNSYNFTISEELPLEVEVAVNPEMLGRIFESMLPEYERGKKGTFYTPRPIVHYMCRESLKEYLCAVSNIPRYKILKLVEEEKIKELSVEEAKILYEALDKVRVLDPAVGSGAFLVGMMQEIIRLKNPLVQKLSIKITPAQLKREIIKTNLYGIDIESEAIEIAKLRLWLSLVVDEELENIEPLPNLDYKLAVGNSLIESFKGKKLLEKEQFQQSLIEDDNQKLITGFRRLKDKLLDEIDTERKNSIRQKLEDIEWKLIEKGLSLEAELKTKQAIELGAKYSQARVEIPASEKRKMEKLIKEACQASDFLSEIKKTGTKPFFLPQVHFAEVFTEKNGFDIIIANPPYVRTQKLSDLPYREDLKLHYGYVDDLYVHFTFRAFELARPKGVVSFITSDTYLTLSWKERMRELLQNHRIQKIILTPKAFEATVNTAIYIVQKEPLSDYNFTHLIHRI